MRDKEEEITPNHAKQTGKTILQNKDPHSFKTQTEREFT